MRKLASIIAVLLVVVLLIPPIQVLAIADPDSPPQITAVYVYEDLLEDGDVGVLIDYFIEYAAIPTEPVTESYLASFIDTDGSTQLGTVAPYTFQYAGYTDDGYNRGMVWIYFTAAEVTADSIDIANEALYEIWLMGNPTIESGWTGDPPKTIGGIDLWYATGDHSTLLALDVLRLAGYLELAWSLDMVETTPLGSRLTTIGEAYFPNVINNLRTMAPGCFAVATIEPELEDLDYSTAFGATIENGTGTLPVSPLTLVEGDNTVDITGAGTFTLELTKGTEGEAVSIVGGCTVVGSPAALVEGTNTITTNLAGTNDILVTVNLVDTVAGIWGLVEGTAFDTTTVAAEFGMTHWMFAGLIWLVLSVVICAAYYKGSGRMGFGSGGGKGVMVIFDLCVVIGIVLGLLNILVGVLLFIASAFLTAYVLFFRGSSF